VVSQARSVPKIAPRSAGDLAIVGYTSGTTGLPKGAMISQGAQRVHFTGPLPRNASMKVRKDQLREQLTGQPAGEGSRRA
jgi:acyl-coenzyme A synthetase/AMP-(fatty) acid ligase